MTWQIPTASSATVWALLLLLGLPLLLLAISLKLATGSLFGGAGRPLIAGIYVLIIAVAALLLASMRVNKVVVHDGQVQLKGSFYSRSLSLGDIDRSSLEVVSLGKPPLAWRTNGVGLPGYRAGWFRDRDGNKVFAVYGTGPWIAFRTRDGIAHAVGVSDPEAAKKALRGEG